MDKNLNELSALYMQNIAEQGPEEQQQRVTQIVKAIRYRARKEGVELAKAYNDYIGSVQATSTERQAVKEKLGLTGGSAHKEEVEYVDESGVGYEVGKPAEKLGAVTGISKSEQEAARERIKAKMAAKKAAKKVVESSYDPMDDDEFDHDEAEENRGVSGKNNPKGGKALGKKKRVVSKEEVSNWREEFIFEVDEPETDTESEKQIKEKKVKNKVVINPPMKEAFEEIGGTILEVVEVEEEMGSAANTQMQNVQRRQLQLDRKKLEIRKKLMSQKQTSAADSTVASEEVENIEEVLSGERYKKVMNKPGGTAYSRKVSADPSKRATRGGRGGESDFGAGDRGSGNRARRRAAELSDTHKTTGGKYRSQYVEDVEVVDEKMDLAKAKMGDVVKDFQKSDAPQFKGKTKKERQKMAIAAKLTAERGGKRLGE